MSTIIDWERLARDYKGASERLGLLYRDAMKQRDEARRENAADHADFMRISGLLCDAGDITVPHEQYWRGVETLVKQRDEARAQLAAVTKERDELQVFTASLRERMMGSHCDAAEHGWAGADELEYQRVMGRR